MFASVAIPKQSPSVRARRPEDGKRAKPIYAVWELTMHCDQPCTHCGSRAAAPRVNELSPEEVLDVAQALIDLGCREVALIGGEAYLRKDVYEIIAFLNERGARVAMQTGGRGITRERARKLADAGLQAVGVSIDGPEKIHDQLRGNVGSHRAALQALDFSQEAGMLVTSNAQVNRLNWHTLRELADEIRAHGAVAWQLALTVAMGNAADKPDLILEPWRVVDVIDTLAEIQLSAAAEHADGIPFNIAVSNNIGYFGPHEQVIRSRPGGREAHWAGCQAGVSTIGIESDGTVKGCPSLPTAPYTGGNVRELALAEIWEHSEIISFARNRSLDELWGYCKDCYYAENCRGGCSWTAHCTLGRRGNNPFCYHRVEQLKKQGIRERLELKERPPGEPYDFGRYEIVEEPWPDTDRDEPRPRTRLPLI